MATNRVVLIGRLTRDAELKYTQGGDAVSKFAIAVDMKKKSGDQWVEEANFFDIVLWGRQAEAINQYLVKGKQVGIDGQLKQEKWEQDGQSRSKIVVKAENVELLGGGQNDARQAPQQQYQQQYQQPQSQAPRQQAPAAQYRQPAQPQYQQPPAGQQYAAPRQPPAGYQQPPAGYQQPPAGYQQPAPQPPSADYSQQDFPDDIPF